MSKTYPVHLTYPRSKIYPVENNNVVIGYVFNCPGCKNPHLMHIKPHRNNLNASWSWNGSFDSPTFNPSILQKIEYGSGKTEICHSWVQDGKIRFLSDCTHNLTGKEVELPDYEQP